MPDLTNINDRTEVLACTAASASETFGSGFANTRNVMIYNKGPNDVFVTSSVGSVAAVFPTTSTGRAGTLIPAGAVATLDKGIADDTINAICNTSETATIYIQFTIGE